MHNQLRRRRTLAVAALAVSALLAIGGCSSSDDSAPASVAEGTTQPSTSALPSGAVSSASSQWFESATLAGVHKIVGSRHAAVVIGNEGSGPLQMRGYSPDGTAKGSVSIPEGSNEVCGLFAFDTDDGPRVGYRQRTSVAAEGIVPEKWVTTIVVRDALTLKEEWSTKVAEDTDIGNTGCSDSTVETITHNGGWVVVSLENSDGYVTAVLDSGSGKLAQELEGYPTIRGDYVALTVGPPRRLQIEEARMIEPGTGKTVAQLTGLYKTQGRMGRNLQGSLLANEDLGGDGERGYVFEDETLYYVSWKDLSVIKKVPLPGEYAGDLLVDNSAKRLYVPVKVDGAYALHALDADRGYAELWHQPGVRSVCAAYPSSVVVAAEESGNFGSLAPSDGKQRSYTSVRNTVGCGLVVGDYTFLRLAPSESYNVVRFAP